MPSVALRKPCGHESLREGCAPCLLFGEDEEFRAAWGGPPLPKPPPDHVQMLVTFHGVGDAVQILCAAEGYRRENPGHHLTYVCLSPRQEAWAALFGGYDALTCRSLRRVPVLRPGSYEAMMCRGKPRWRHYADNCGVKEPVLPPARPIPPEVTERAAAWRGCVVLCPGSTDPHRRWPLDRWLDLERRIGPERCLAIDDDPGRLGGFTNTAGLREGPQEIAALMLGARLVVSNDSGLAHVAGTLRVPTLLLGNFRRFYDGYGLYPTVMGLHRQLRDLPPEEVWPHVRPWL